MRLLASLTAAAALLGAFAVPADAYKKRIHVDYLDCYVEVELPDVLVSVGSRGVRVERAGDTGGHTTC